MRKYLGLPIVTWLVIALVGTACAWLCFVTISSTSKVQEPLSTSNVTDFSDTMYPGESNTWTWDIGNSADVAYSIKADLTYSAPSGVSITSFVFDCHDETDDLLDDNSAEFDIPADGTISCSLTIEAAKDAGTGPVSVKLELSRE